jgi:hypothetical protein
MLCKSIENIGAKAAHEMLVKLTLVVTGVLLTS